MNRDINSESLIGGFSPIYLGEALKYFFSHMSIEYNVNGRVIDIIDYFPLLKEGYCLKECLRMVTYQYIHAHNLLKTVEEFDEKSNLTSRWQIIIPDQLFLETFDGNITADFYFRKTNNKILKMSMDKAVEEGIIKNSLTTFESFEQYMFGALSKYKYKDEGQFNRRGFLPHYLDSLVIYNFYNKQDLKDLTILQQLEDPQIIKQMIYEHSLIYQLSSIDNSILTTKLPKETDYFKYYLKYVTLKEFSELTLKFLNDERILITSENNEDFINVVKRIRSPEVIERFLQFDVINPRYNGDKAFNFLINKYKKLSNLIKDYEDYQTQYEVIANNYDEDDPNNDEIEKIVKLVQNINKYKERLQNLEVIIDILKNAMFKRYWIEKEVYASQLEPMRGKSTIPRDVMYHARKYFAQ